MNPAGTQLVLSTVLALRQVVLVQVTKTLNYICLIVTKITFEKWKVSFIHFIVAYCFISSVDGGSVYLT